MNRDFKYLDQQIEEKRALIRDTILIIKTKLDRERKLIRTGSAEKKNLLPESNEVAIVDHGVGMGVLVGDEEVDHNVHQEGELAGDVQKKEVLLQPSEEAELHGREERGVDRPYQDEVGPQYVPPAP